MLSCTKIKTQTHWNLYGKKLNENDHRKFLFFFTNCCLLSSMHNNTEGAS